MNLIYMIIFFILGLHMGSFYTVVGLRLPNHEKFITGRSHCDHCNHSLSFFDMIPLLSYFFYRGKCRYCKSKISPLSSYMEFFSGILYLLSYIVFGFTFEMLIALGIVSLLIIVSVSDISYYVIPDELLVFFSVYFYLLILLKDGFSYSILSLLSGVFLFTVMYLIMIFGNYLFKKESLGGGDIKMMFVFGLILPPLLGVISIFLGSFLALPVSLLILLKKKNHLVPFGPFLLISLTFLYFTQINVEMILSFFKLLSFGFIG
ncbi:MAG: prepilin peptidase [Bacilli bacterium]|nr:prepilin peptidase [Bacilli bacterium]